MKYSIDPKSLVGFHGVGMTETKITYISIKIMKETKCGPIFNAFVKPDIYPKMAFLIQSILSSINSFYTFHTFHFMYYMHSPFLLTMNN